MKGKRSWKKGEKQSLKNGMKKGYKKSKRKGEKNKKNTKKKKKSTKKEPRKRRGTQQAVEGCFGREENEGRTGAVFSWSLSLWRPAGSQTSSRSPPSAGLFRRRALPLHPPKGCPSRG